VKKQTIKPDEILIDPKTDEVGQLLRAMERYKTWTKERRALLDAAIKKMKKMRHVEFTSGVFDFHLSRVGTSLLYEVPNNKRGNLKPFRGRVIRLVCVGSGSHFYRYYIAVPYRATTHRHDVQR